MKCGLYYLLLLPLWVGCRSLRPTAAQLPAGSPVATASKAPCQVPFTPPNPDEADAREHFRDHYHLQAHSRYTNPIRMVQQPDVVNFIYNHTDTLQLSEPLAVFYPLFTSGLLYPHVAANRLYSVTELRQLSIDCEFPHRRRFSFWHYTPGELNPDVYVFELTNPQATAQTDIANFVRGATLTFMELGWSVL